MSSQTNTTPNNELPQSLDRQLSTFRRRLRIVKLIEVAMAAIAGFLIAYFLVFIVERFTALSAAVRAAILILGTAGFSVLIPMALGKWFWSIRRAEQIARYLRGTFPVLGDEILSVIEMNGNQARHGASPRLIAAATEQTCDRVAKHNLEQAAPANTAKKRVMVTMGITGVTALLLLVVPSAAGNSWLRFLNPWTDTARFTFTKLKDLPNEKVVPYGESFLLNVGVHESSKWKPKTAAAKIGPNRIEADRTDDAYLFSLPAQTNVTEVNVSAGDDSRFVSITPKTRPELTTIVARTNLPDYLQYRQPFEQNSSTRRFSAVVGSTMEFDLIASRELQSASIDEMLLPVENQTVAVGPIEVDTDSTHTVNWRDIYGLQPRKPIELEIHAVNDQAPSVVFERFENRVLLQDKSIRFGFTGRDDFGIRKIGIQWVGQPKTATEPIHGEKLLYAGNPENWSVDEQGVFTPSLENVAPQVLTMRLFVEDYFPNRGRIYSRTQLLHVLSHDEHVAWINKKMQAWKSSADAIYEREVALTEENRELRMLSPQELRKPENLRRMENQAAAEKDNAQRLKRAVDQGESLIEKALANKNLRSEQVAKWAASLEALRKIAKQDMRGIADQLNQLSNAMRAESGQQGASNSQQNQSAPGDKKDSDKKDNDQKGSDKEGKKKKESDGKEPNNSDGEKSSDDSNSRTVGKNRLNRKPQQSEPPERSDDEAEQSPSSPSESKPRLRDVEDSMLEHKEGQSDSESGAGNGGGGSLDLPATSLLNPQLDNGQQEQGNEETEAEAEEEAPQDPTLDGVVEDQQQLLEEFEKAREAMDEVMGEFENSTFVKRFKKAARTQLELAGRLNRLVPDRFGESGAGADFTDEDIARLADSHKEVATVMRQLKTDLEAYQSRESADAVEAILDEMNGSKMQVKLEELPLRLQKNRLGDSLHRSEFWADTFDRWAEELVPPARPASNGGDGGGGGGERKSLPPAILLEVLRQVEDEMNLRDETRGFNLSRKAMSSDEQQQRNDGLTVYQMAVQERSLDTIDNIRQLADGEQHFGRTLGKLRKAVQSMDEATGMLFDSTTDAPVLAAESAAIEALLESRRFTPPNSNSDPEEDNSGLDGSESLADAASPMSRLKPGGLDPQIAPRDVGAGTSANFANVPERFRDGVDSFTNQLGKLRKNLNPRGESK